MVSNENDPEAQDAFERGFHGIPSDQQLRAMSYVELASLLASSEKGSAKYFVVERERIRRDALELAQSRPEQGWYDKPIGKIAVGIVIGVLVFLVTYLIQKNIVVS